MSQMLRPGAVILEREPGVVQVGLRPPRRALVADTPGVRRFLSRLRRGSATPQSTEEHVALRALHSRGLLVSAAAGPARPTVGLSLVSPEFRDPVLRGLVQAEFPRPALDQPADVELALTAGEIERDRLDPLMRQGRPHLVVLVEADIVRIGPFVYPGETTCLRCLDAYDALEDPRHHLMVAQAARLAAAAEPAVGAAQLQLALGWALAELTRAATSASPLTRSGTITIDPVGVRHHALARHPHCGCAWDALRASG